MKTLRDNKKTYIAGNKAWVLLLALIKFQVPRCKFQQPKELATWNLELRTNKVPLASLFKIGGVV